MHTVVEMESLLLSLANDALGNACSHTHTCTHAHEHTHTFAESMVGF